MVSILAASLLTAQIAFVAQAPAFRDLYAKQEHLVPMRDGTRLYTAVYVPKAAGAHPILLHRTGYSAGPYGPTEFRDPWGSPQFVEKGYVFVYQDVRGRYMSEGDFEHVRPSKTRPEGTDETTDTYDTIEWLVKHVPENNGRVGISGISYPGFYASMGAVDSHPALRAASPQAPVTDWWEGDDFHHHGALLLQDGFSFLSWFEPPRKEPGPDAPPSMAPSWPDGYAFFLGLGGLGNVNEKVFKGRARFWEEILAHPDYDAFWKARDTRPRLKNVRCAVLTVGGFYDAEDLWGALETYRAIERNNPGIDNTLVMGPWSHGMWANGAGNVFGDFGLGSDTGTFFRENVEFPFFDHYLRGGPAPKLPEALVFETGTNQWRSFDAFPPPVAPKLSFYLSEGGRLGVAKPADEAEASDEYVSDPAHPVPYTSEIRPNRNREYMNADQRFASRRPDVLTYETPPLPADLTVAGPLRAELFAALSGTDADFVVKVVDVFPDDIGLQNNVVIGGYQMLVRAEVVRGRYRDGGEKSKPFVPDQPTRVTVPLNDVMHTFRKGHRLMVQVQSSWFPLVSRNPQSFIDIGKAKSEDYQKATVKIFRDAKHPSSLAMTVLPE